MVGIVRPGPGLWPGAYEYALVFVLVGIGLAVGFGIGLPLYAMTKSVGWAVALGLLPFIAILAVPMILVHGLWLTFKSSAWTLAYREIAVAKG